MLPHHPCPQTHYLESDSLEGPDTLGHACILGLVHCYNHIVSGSYRYIRKKEVGFYWLEVEHKPSTFIFLPKAIVQLLQIILNASKDQCDAFIHVDIMVNGPTLK